MNDVWVRLRQLSVQFDVLLITATQADAKARQSAILDAMNFSEDKRKMAHVTAMVGLNQTDVEKQEGIIRLNVIVAREVEYSISKSVKVLFAPDIGRPILKNL